MRRTIRTGRLTIVAGLFTLLDIVTASSWSEWWGYEGISGPDFWGKINPEWTLCDLGKYQSPIDINPGMLLYDPNLRLLNISMKPVPSEIVNTGHDLTIYLRPERDPDDLPVITGGPLTYQYRVHRIIIHFGSEDNRGSEHKIAGNAFPLEIQLVSYNEDLFASIQHASRSSFGIAIVSFLGQVNESGSGFVGMFAKNVSNIRYKGYRQQLPSVSIGELLPKTSQFITYEGSLTHPGCQEVVTWIIVNKPFYVSKSQLEALRSVYRVDRTKNRSRMENNFRPVRAVNNRVIRTNIRPNKQSTQCRRRRTISYEVNNRFLT